MHPNVPAHSVKELVELAREELGLRPDLPTLLVTGGSLGAQRLNETLAEAMNQGFGAAVAAAQEGLASAARMPAGMSGEPVAGTEIDDGPEVARTPVGGAEHEERERHRLRLAHPAAAAHGDGDQPGARDGEPRVPRERLR